MNDKLEIISECLSQREAVYYYLEIARNISLAVVAVSIVGGAAFAVAYCVERVAGKT